MSVQCTCACVSATQSDAGRPARPWLCLATLVPVMIRFKSVGSAPVMKNNYYRITASNRFQVRTLFALPLAPPLRPPPRSSSSSSPSLTTHLPRRQTVVQFLRKELNWKPTDPLVRPLSVSSRPSLRGHRLQAVLLTRSFPVHLHQLLLRSIS